MDQIYRTPLKGCIALSDDFLKNQELQRDKTLYKIFWVKRGHLELEIDHVPLSLTDEEIVSLTPLQHLEVKKMEGEIQTLLFNSNFYCIYGHDNEVSCGGLLFHGSSEVMRLKLSVEEVALISQIVENMKGEFQNADSLQEEMLRILLKRFIIICTRIARQKLDISVEKEHSFDIVRRYYVLVDNHFREKKQVRDYADLLFRSPKTLSNLFSACGLPSPLSVIHERVISEAKRMLLYTTKTAKEITTILGFEDQASFSRFFKQQTGESISRFREQGKADERALAR
jgi:AraC family transcriptional activator of pobA